jgi:hypothetical protein
MLAIVIRGTKVLAKPSTTDPIPTVEEVESFTSVIESFDYNTVRVIQHSTGTPPDDWRWIPIMELQGAVDTDVSDALGEALVCGG